MEAIGYFSQVSKAKLNEAVLTLEEQQSAFARLCAEQGFQSVATFSDRDSGANAGRGHRQLMAFLRQPGRGFMVVALSLTNEVLRDAKASARRTLELEDVGAQVMNLEGDTGVTFLDEIIAAWRRQRDSERLSGRAMDTLRTKALRGFGLGKTPYGYGIGANGKLEIIEQEARVVRQLYQMYVEQNLGLRLIARHLNDANTPTRRGSRWSVVTVRDILRNRTYTGTYSRFGMRVPGSHPAIIPPDVFREVQKKREHVSGGRPVGRESSFSLSGLAYCGACNGHMIGVSRTQSWSRKRDGGRTQTEYRYYRCGSRVNQSICNYHTWRAEDLESIVLNRIRQTLHPADPTELTPAPLPTPEALQTIKSKVKSLDGRFQRYLDNTAKGVLTMERLRTTALPIIRELQRLEQRLAVVNSPLDGQARHEAWLKQQRSTLQELEDRWQQLSPADRRLYLGDLVGRIVAYDDRVDVQLNS